MSFVGDVLGQFIVDVIVYIVEAVISIVEMIVQLIMILLGWDSGSTQIIEYYEVHNIPLFDDVDKKNPLLNSVLQSVIENQDITGNLIYLLAFRSLKGNVKDFMSFIDNGLYFESFPTVESYILTIDHTELTAALNTLNGVPCTPEGSYLRALSRKDWVKYWLQENKGYDVGINQLGTEYREVTTSPATPAGDTIIVTPSLNHFDIVITSETVTSDDVLADMRWQVNLNNIVYNAVPDTYTIQVYNSVGVIITLPYTAPTKPLQLHYISTYYRDSDPFRYYLFIYKVGTGVYTDLDTVETPIDQDGATIEALPAIPLRVSNADYTTFGATKSTQIEDLLDRILLDAEAILDTVVTESGVAPGDLDHIYVNFGVRMWDTSQAGMSYLYNMFENLYPSQGVTQGTYDNSPPEDDKPHNNILTTTDDNKLAFQWSYITYEHTSLVDIDADSGSVENGIYYSDMSKFDASNILIWDYYVSSGKGMYNVGYKSDDLDEVQDFLDGSGVINPGITTTEAANWMQVTERMSYNNPSPNLLEDDDSASDLKYLTPDLIYENNGSGVLRIVQKASPETTIGQSITYYCCKPSGLDAYTVVAPIASVRVIDGDSGHFRVVKFNLGNKGDLMAPFIYNFIKDLSNDKVSRLFLAGCHCSIYIAHYEKIVHEGMSWLTALVMIIIIVVIIIVAWPMIVNGFAAMGTAFAELAAAAAAGTFLTTAWGMFLAAIPNIIIKMAAQYIIQVVIAEIAGDNEELAMILNLVAMVAVSAWDPGVSYGQAAPGFIGPMPAGAPSSFHYSGMGFDWGSLANPLKLVGLALDVVNGLNRIAMRKESRIAAEIAQERAEWMIGVAEEDAHLRKLEELIAPNYGETHDIILQSLRNENRGAALGGEVTYALFTAQYDVPYLAWAITETIEVSVSGQVAI